MSDLRKDLEALFLDAAQPNEMIDRTDAVNAGVPTRFLDLARRMSLQNKDPQEAREAAQRLAESIEQVRSETSSLDPAELARLTPRL